MNILLFVMTILMALSLLTYARLENYRTFSGMKAQFSTYMESIERKPINEAAKKWYDDITVNTKFSPIQREQAPGGCARLSLFLLLNKEARDKAPEMHQQTRTLAKQLMIALYGGERFFKEMASEHPTFLDEILTEIETLSDALPEGKKIIKTEGLATLQLSNESLHRVFNRMLHGELPAEIEKEASAPAPLFTKVEFSFGLSVTLPEEADNNDDELDAAIESDEAHAPEGYVSLIDHITVVDRKKIRVYLASRALLLAIYGDRDIVESIIEARKALFKQLKAEGTLKNALSQQFKDNFSNSGQAPSYSAILDFTVTKTDPKGYE